MIYGNLKKEIIKIMTIFKTSESELRPHFILTGPSGSGKTHVIKSLADQFELPFFEINAAQLTKEGTAGNSLSKALTPLTSFAGQPTICFVDEFDKLFVSGNHNSDIAHEVTTGVQNEFLKVLESDTTSVFGDYGKYLEVDSSNILFIFAGSFNGEEDITIDKLREFGVKTEFLGRVGLTYSTSKFSIEQMLSILKSSDVLQKYLLLFPDVKKKMVVETISKFIQINYEKNTIGARLINTLIHQFFIKGGNLGKDEVKTISFQKTLKIDD